MDCGLWVDMAWYLLCSILRNSLICLYPIPCSATLAVHMYCLCFMLISSVSVNLYFRLEFIQFHSFVALSIFPIAGLVFDVPRR